MKEVHGSYVSLVSGTFDPTNSTKKKKKKEGKSAELDRRVRYLAPFLVHQSDREIPTKAFSRGVTDLTKLHGQEMPAVLLMLILAVGDSGVILPTSVSRPIACLAWGLLCFHSYLMSSVWNRGMRTRFPGLTTYIMDKFSEVIGPIRKTDADPAGLKFPKFHQMVHYLFFGNVRPARLGLRRILGVCDEVFREEDYGAHTAACPDARGPSAYAVSRTWDGASSRHDEKWRLIFEK